MNEQRLTKLLSISLVLLAVTGCARDPLGDLTDHEKYLMSKQCVDAGMWPDVYSRRVVCMAVPHPELERK